MSFLLCTPLWPLGDFLDHLLNHTVTTVAAAVACDGEALTPDAFGASQQAYLLYIIIAISKMIKW